ncbi:transcriptional regulator [Opitutaceae bacterium TAV1]|nr:transcriptional regulator [Opitutaceae bacterium TAV1]
MLHSRSAKVSLPAIAAATGVSASTVSRALNDDPRIAQGTRKKVVEAARRMGYQKNASVTALMRGFRRGDNMGGHREVLAFLSHHDPREWSAQSYLEHYPQMLAGASERAENLGYRVEVFWLHEPGRSFARLGSILAARGIRGVILGPLPECAQLNGFPWEYFAAVALGYMLETPILHRVQNDMYDNMSIVLEKFSTLGLRRIGFATHSKVEQRLGRLAAARFAVHQLGLPEADRIPILFTDSAHDPALGRWLREWKPDAIVGQMDYVWPTIRKAKRREGDSVSFAWLAAQRNMPEFGGTVPRHEAIGAAALDLLISLVAHGDKGVPAEPRSILIPGAWRRGKTVFGKT